MMLERGILLRWNTPVFEIHHDFNYLFSLAILSIDLVQIAPFVQIAEVYQIELLSPATVRQLYTVRQLDDQPALSINATTVN